MRAFVQDEVDEKMQMSGYETNKQSGFCCKRTYPRDYSHQIMLDLTQNRVTCSITLQVASVCLKAAQLSLVLHTHAHTLVSMLV